MAEVHSDYGGVKQRWIVVESAPRTETDLEKLQKKIDKEQKSQQTALAKLSTKEFSCESDAIKAGDELVKKMKFHSLSNIQALEKIHYSQSGRPSKDKTPSRITYHFQADLVVNAQNVTLAENQAGRFIIATNLTDKINWTPIEILSEYKKQSVNERGFKFLKDPIFFADSVFVKTPRRVAALAMIMALCLIVYTIGQRQLRSNLVMANATVPNQLGKPTQSPTLRWIFQCFQSIHVVLVSGVKIISNLTDERKNILQFFGTACGKYYLLS